MTAEELLKPRYKVIADYPGCSFEVGTILIPDNEGELFSPTAGYSWTVTRIMEKDVKKFLHLVEPLPWYADRKPEDLPEYVKLSEKGKERYFEHVWSNVFKVAAWDKGWFQCGEEIPEVYDNTDFLFTPATKEEYDNYKNRK